MHQALGGRALGSERTALGGAKGGARACRGLSTQPVPDLVDGEAQGAFEVLKAAKARREPLDEALAALLPALLARERRAERVERRAARARPGARAGTGAVLGGAAAAHAPQLGAQLGAQLEDRRRRAERPMPLRHLAEELRKGRAAAGGRWARTRALGGPAPRLTKLTNLESALA